jgi:hypothetical protein
LAYAQIFCNLIDRTKIPIPLHKDHSVGSTKAGKKAVDDLAQHDTVNKAVAVVGCTKAAAKFLKG